jgi:hypothetical protein
MVKMILMVCLNSVVHMTSSVCRDMQALSSIFYIFYRGTYNAPLDGKTTYGGYSDSVVVAEDFVLSIPDNLPLAGVAPLLCAGITGYSFSSFRTDRPLWTLSAFSVDSCLRRMHSTITLTNLRGVCVCVPASACVLMLPITSFNGDVFS